MTSPKISQDIFNQPLSESQNQLELQNQVILCVKKFICQANPLMRKVQFSSYNPMQHYPVIFQKLPSILNADCVIKEDTNNMQLIQESAFRHQKMKRDALKAIYGSKPQSAQQSNKNLPTLEQYYQNKVLIYDKLGNYQNQNAIIPQVSTNQIKPKDQQFATYVMDLSSIIKKQNQKCQTAQNNVKNRNRITTSQGCFRNFQKHQIQFSSNFQSGNLFKVYQKQHNQYDLILQNDINTKGNNQWFFFSVKGATKGTTLKFNLVNLSKKQSLFQDGMKPTIFSMVRFEKRQIGWIRQGTKITYEENTNVRRLTSLRPYYCLSFEYKFIYDGDIVYFSHSYPYTLTNLSQYLSNHLSNNEVQKNLKFKNIASTLGGNKVDMIQISNQDQIKNSAKKIVWIFGRQHPGQVSGSFMMEGVIDFLLSSHEQAQFLIKNFVFKVVPMVNVDGVIHGNSRAEIIGCDPNRKWDNPHKIYNPVIYALRKMIDKDKGRISMVLDLHSHSRKLGTFFYGNIKSQIIERNQPKIFPAMVCKNDERFTMKHCRFGGGSHLAARRILFEKHQIPLIYTIESSFYGYQKNDYRIIPYYPQDYKQMGDSVLKTFATYIKQKCKQLNPQKFLLNKNFLEDQIMKNFDSDFQQKLQKDSQGSDSNPSEDQFTEKQLKKLLPKTFDIKKKTKNSILKKKKTASDKKQNKQLEQTKQIKIKKIEKDSHYKKYFSSRNSQLELTPIRQKQTKQKKQFSIQVDIDQSFALKQSINRSTSDRKVQSNKGSGGPLCIFGKKLDNTVGVQVDMKKQFTKNRNDFFGNARRNSLKLPCRPSSILQIKENNFLNRGLGNTLTSYNFFNSKR